jgi:CspA family cold shock protein
MDSTIELIGTVKKLFDRGFGFIVPEDGKGEIFFHAGRCRGFDGLRLGDQVAFHLDEGRKGPQAVNVQKVS